MGEWRNEFNRRWDPYGGWEWGEDLERELQKKRLDAQESYELMKKRSRRDNDCTCCQRKYVPRRLVGAHCERCVSHARCINCGVAIIAVQDGFVIRCPVCEKDAEESFKRVVRVGLPTFRRDFMEWLKSRPRPAVPFACTYHKYAR